MSFWVGLAIGLTVGTVLGVQLSILMAIKFLADDKPGKEK